MNKINFLILSGGMALLAASCADNASTTQFTLNGEVSGFDGKEIYLYLGQERIDTAIIADGKFTFIDTIAHEQSASIIVGEYSYENRNHFTQFFIEPGSEMTLSLPTDSFPAYTLTGCKAEDLNRQLNDSMKELTDQIQSLHTQQQAATDPAAVDSLDKLQEKASGRIDEMIRTFIKSNPDSYVAAYYTRHICGRSTYDQLKDVYDALSPRIQQSSEVEDLYNEITALERVLPGKPAPNIAKNDINGKAFDMSSLKGNVILLDFWASWCKPCRASNPHVKALYDKYHDKGLEVVMVSDDDSNEDAWRKAVEDDQTAAFHHVLRGLKRAPEGSAYPYDRSEDVSDLYAIHYLPTKYLIDRNFCIIGKVNDEELDAKLQELFGF